MRALALIAFELMTDQLQVRCATHCANQPIYNRANQPIYNRANQPIYNRANQPIYNLSGTHSTTWHKKAAKLGQTFWTKYEAQFARVYRGCWNKWSKL